MMKFRIRLAAVIGCILFANANDARAQRPSTWDVNQPTISRLELEQLHARLDSAAASAAYSDALRAQARLQSAAVKNRLQHGDFQVGDQVAVIVEGQLTDTFDIQPNRILSLPGIGDVPLEGVLRSELSARIREYVARVIVDPVVRARPLVNIAVVGQVVRPGYYTVQIDALLTEALMLAGGPTATADIDKVVIQRGTEQIYTPTAIQEAIISGKTLNQLGLRAGDRIMVPAQQRRSFGELLRLAIVALPSLAFLFSRL